MELTKAQQKLAAVLLRIAADEFSNHGCNDFNLLTEGNFTREEALELANDIHQFQKKDDVTYAGYPANPAAKDLYTYDWLLMRMIAEKLEE